MVRNAVMQLNQTILEAFHGVQLQGHVTVTPRDQGNTIPDKHRGHADDELVDRVLVQKGGDELAAAHQPDVLSGRLPETADERADGTARELHARRGAGRWRLTGEDDVPTLRVELRPDAQALLVGLPAQQLRVDRLREGVHAIETFGSRAGRQPFDIVVGTRDVTVRAGGDVDDDLSALRHEDRSPLAIGRIIQSASLPTSAYPTFFAAFNFFLALPPARRGWTPGRCYLRSGGASGSGLLAITRAARRAERREMSSSS